MDAKTEEKVRKMVFKDYYFSLLPEEQKDLRAAVMSKDALNIAQGTFYRRMTYGGYNRAELNFIQNLVKQLFNAEIEFV